MLVSAVQAALRTAQQKVEVLLARNGEETIEALSDDEDDDDVDER